MAATESQGGLPAPPNDHQIIENWLKSTYLEYRYIKGDEDLRIQVKDFFNIITTASSVVDPSDSWISGEVLDLVTVVLTQVQEQRTDILVLPSLPTEMIAYVGLGRKNKDEFIM